MARPGAQFTVVYGRRRVGKTTLWELISEGFRPFVGRTAFEEIGRTRTLEQAAAGRLSFIPDAIGCHWSRDSEIDVVTTNQREQQVLLGECKWGTDAIGRNMVRSLIEERGPRALARLEGDQQPRYTFFARAGFADAARKEATQVGATMVDLAQLDRELQRQQ